MKIDITTNERYKKVLNSDWYKKIFNIYSDIIKGTYEFYKEKKFDVAALPVTTGSISSPMGLGSDSKPVKINLLGQTTYLADSMQFLLEYISRFNKNGVYYVMPTFRGEDTDNRHLQQFYHSEVEIPGDLTDIMNLGEQYVKYLAKYIISTDNFKSMNFSEEHINNIRNITQLEKFPEVYYDATIKKFENKYPEGIEYRDGLKLINSKGEQKLLEENNGVVWLSHFDHRSVPFYQQFDPENHKNALAADLLIGMGETLGCGERADYQSLKESLSEHKVSDKEYHWYIDMKKEFQLKTSGFGMGIERFIAWITNHYDIRDMPIVYRDKNYEIEP